jgi:effector-binding domain-containing protein
MKEPPACSLVDVSARPLAVVRVTTRLVDWPREFRGPLDTVYAAVHAGRVTQRGQNVMVYYPRTDGRMDIACGVETPARFEAVGEVVYAETPSGPAATTVHVGRYDRLRATHEALDVWCRANGHRLAGPCWEIYGDWHQDETRLRTELFHLVLR